MVLRWGDGGISCYMCFKHLGASSVQTQTEPGDSSLNPILLGTHTVQRSLAHIDYSFCLLTGSVTNMKALRRIYLGHISLQAEPTCLFIHVINLWHFYRSAKCSDDSLHFSGFHISPPKTLINLLLVSDLLNNPKCAEDEYFVIKDSAALN